MSRMVILVFATLLFGSGVNAQDPSPGRAYFHFSMAKLYQAEREYSQAIEEFEKAVELDADSVTLRTEFAETLLEAREIDRAIEQCQFVIERDPAQVAARLVLARAYLDMRQADKTRVAVAELGRVLEIDADNLEALSYMGRIQLSQRDFEAAAKTFGRLVEADGANVQSYFMQGHALRELGRHGEAIDVLERGLRVRSPIAEYLTLLAETYEADERPEEALPLYDRAYGLAPQPELGQHLARLRLEQGKTDEAVTLLEELVAGNPQKMQFQVDLARAHKVAHRYEEAVEVLQRVVENNENDLEANFELGVVLGLLGERSAAADRLRQLLGMTQPNAFQDHIKLNLALIYQDSRNFDDALELLEELAAASPDDLDAKLRLFYTLHQAQRTDEAGQIAQLLRREHPESPYTSIAEAQLMADSGELDKAISKLRQELDVEADSDLLYGEVSRLYMDGGRFEDAQRVVQEALVMDPDSPRMRYLLGAVLERQKEFTRAEKQFVELLRLNPDDSDALNYLGYMLADRGVRLPDALEYLEKAVSIDPYNGSYLDSLGWVYFKLDRLEDAEHNLQKANRINSFDPVILEHLGDLYCRLGDTEQARAYYEQSVSFSEEEEELSRVQEKLSQIPSSP